MMNAVTEPGKWYFWFKCKTCSELIPYTECTPDAFVGGDDSAVLLIPCEACKSLHDYRLSEILRLPCSAPPKPH